MVALRNKKAKAKAASRKAVEKAATKQRAAAAAKTDDAASADAGDWVEESAEERVRKLVAFLTHAALAIPVTAVAVVEGEEHGNPAKSAAASLSKMLTRTDVAPFLDAMIVAQCASVKDKALTPQQILSRLTSASRKRICGVIFKADEIAYSCRNCQVDSTCVICKDCFMLGDHSGHDVYFQRTTAGSSCDCGDLHAWKRTGFCSRHPGAQEDHDAASKKTNLPKALASMAPVVIEAVVDFLYQVYLGIDQGFEFAEALEVFSRDIPPSLLADLVAPRNATPATAAASPPPPPAVAPVASIESRRRPRQGGNRRSPLAVDTVRTSTANSRPIPSPSPSTAQNIVVRLHNDDVHSLGEVIKDLCAAMGCGSFQARASVSEADRQGDSVVAKMSLVKCAAPVSSLVRASLNISVVPVWWEKHMERVPAILEWLRTISMTSDGLYELVSEAIRKKRPRRLGPPATISSFFAKGTTCSSFWKAHRVRLHPTTQAIIDEVAIGGSDDGDLHGWGAEVEERFQQMYKFSDTDDVVGALPLSNVEQCDNVLIVEFLKSVALNPAYGRYQCVREGCNGLMTRFFVANDKAPSSLLGVMVRWDCALRKRVAHLGHALLREHMLNKTFRKCMLESYATSYGAMTQSYLKGLGTSPDSIFDFAVQFLTVPQLVKDYTRTEVEKDPSKPQLAYELLAATEKVLAAAVKKAASDGEEDTLNVDHPALSSQKYKHCIDDLEYVFNVGALPNELVCDDRNLGLWISCLKMLQNGDLQARRGIRESHVEYESDSWLSMFNLGIRVHSIFPVSWNGMTPEALANKQQTVKHISQQIIDTVISSSIAANQKTTTKTIVPIKALRCGTNGTSECEVYDFNVSASKTSLHVPLHRFLASSIRHVSIHVSWLQEVLNAEGLLAAFALDQLPSEKKIELVELPLRSLVMASQIQSNLWRRNGEENMMAQLYNYSALPYCVHYRDADVFLMQVAILLLGPDTLLSLMVDRFQLGDFFKCQSMGYAPQEEGVDAQQELQMVEEFLRLIIVLGTSLPSSSGEEYENQFMEEEMLQHLCAKPASFSKLFDIAMLPTGQDDVSVPRLEDVLTRVADFSPPSGLDPGRYELKEGLLEAYNPYCLHLNREAHELARDRWTNYRKAQRLKHRAASSTPLIVPPLKRMQRPLRFLQKARTILTCEGTLTLVHVILWRLAQDVKANSGGGTGFTVSDAVISTMLHLLVYGVYAAEETREVHDSEVNADAFWVALCSTAEALGDSSLISLLWSLRGGKGHSASGLLDDDQTSTLDWLLSKGRECSTDCAEALDRLEQSDHDAKHTASGQGSASGSDSGSLTTQAAESMEQRKDEARKRALEAMARQQAAFQAMMADMGDEDEEDMEAEPSPGDLNEEGNSSSTLGKRRASVDDAATDVEDSKRPRLSDAAHDAGSMCYKCILCHDTATQGEMGMAAYVHQSTVLTGSFRPDPEEGLQPRGTEVRKQVKALIEKMDLCSGGPTVSSNSPSPALRALAAQFPDWYMDDGFDEELMLDPPMPHLNAVGNQRQIRHNTGTNADQNARNQRRRPAIEAFLMGQDEDDMEMLEGVLDLREDQRLFPLPILGGTGASPERRDRGVRRPPGADRGIVVARRGAPMQGVESDFDDDDSDEYDEDDHQFHHHHHHHHHHHPHNHNHSPRRPRSHSRTASVPLHLTPCGLHIRTCQHAVHIHCLERYIRSLHEKAIRGEDFDGVQAIDPDAAMTQFLCPLCKTLCNFLIPTSDPGGNDPRLAIASRGADPSESSSSWYTVVERQLKVPGWYRAVLGRDGDFGDGDNDAHDMWRDYFEETLWEPHGSLEKGAPFLWSACAFSVASFLNVADEEFESTSSSGDFDPLTQSCPPSVEKEFTSLIAVTKFCRWSFSLLEHSEDAKVIWETAKRCNPINTETKREYRKFTKVLGSIDACLRGTILGLLVADTFTAFVISSVIADTPATIWQCIPVFGAADFLQRVYTEFFVQSKTDDRSLLQDKYSILKDSLALDAAADAVVEEVPRRTRRSSRLAIQPDVVSPASASWESEHKPSATKSPSAKDVVRAMQESEVNKNSEEYAVLTLLARILESEPEEQLKPLTKHTVTTRLQRIKTFNGLLVRRMKLFYRCLAEETRDHVLDPSSVAIPSATDIAASPKPVFSQIWKWCVDRIKSKSYLGSAKDGDKCEHAEGCGEGYIASMFILRDQVRKPRLIELPVQYDELYGTMSGRKCARCDKTPCDPGVCLLCGEFLCCGDACCSHPYVNHGPQVGECTRHAAECGGGIGIVLMLDQCRVAIIGGSMAAHFPCPYVDAHGEEDVGLQRGRPLRLDAARYRYLESLWLNHRIFAEVSRLRNQREPQFTINLSYL